MTENLVLNPEIHMLCEDEEGNIQQSDDPSNPGVLIYNKLDNTVTIVPNTDKIRGILPSIRLLLQEVDQSLDIKDGIIEDIEEPQPTDEEIWVKNSGKPTINDREAAETLIALIKSDRYKNQLKTKSIKKRNVWAQIGQEMKELGYNFGIRDPGTVCFQKWRNIEARIVTFIQNGGQRILGSGKLHKPAFYDDVKAIIKDLAKDSPVNDQARRNIRKFVPVKKLPVLSSNKVNNLSTTLNETNDDDKKAKRQKVDFDSIFDFLKQDAEERKKQNDLLIKLLIQKIEQDKETRAQLMEVLSKLVEK